MNPFLFMSAILSAGKTDSNSWKQVINYLLLLRQLFYFHFIQH